MLESTIQEAAVVTQTPWHQHLKVISNPLPPWFSQPHRIDCLIHLDGLNEETGAVAVVPESHNWLDQASLGTYADRR